MAELVSFCEKIWWKVVKLHELTRGFTVETTVFLLCIPSQLNSNDFTNFFTEKIDNIRNTITNVDMYLV